MILQFANKLILEFFESFRYLMSNKIIMSTLHIKQGVSKQQTTQVCTQECRFQGKTQQEINMLETHCTLNQSIDTGTLDQSRKGKLRPFQKIKLSYLNQKNNKGSILKKDVINTQNILSIVQNLQDAITIFSEESPKNQEYSQVSDEQNETYQDKNVQNMELSLLCSLKKKKVAKNSFCFTGLQQRITKVTYTEPNQQVNQSVSIALRVVRQTSKLAIINQKGVLVHFDLYQKMFENLTSLIELQKKRLLKLYHIQPIKNVKIQGNLNSFSGKKFIALFEPYTQTLTQHLLRCGKISFNKLCQIISELILALIQGSQIGGQIQIDPNNVVMICQDIKIKLQLEKLGRVKCRQKLNTMSNLGIYLHSHFKLLFNNQNGLFINKLDHANLFKRLKMKKFIQDLQKNKISCLLQAYHRSLDLGQQQAQQL